MLPQSPVWAPASLQTKEPRQSGCSIAYPAHDISSRSFPQQNGTLTSTCRSIQYLEHILRSCLLREADASSGLSFLIADWNTWWGSATLPNASMFMLAIMNTLQLSEFSWTLAPSFIHLYSEQAASQVALPLQSQY